MEYTVKVGGIMQTANGKSRVRPGQIVSMTEQERATNAALFVEPVVYVAADADIVYTFPIEPPLAEIMKPVRHTPKAEPKVAPVRSGIKRR